MYESNTHEFNDLRLYRHAFEVFAGILVDHQHILDVGCGPGNVAKYLVDLNPTLRITGVDFAPEMIALAKEKVPSAIFETQDMRTIKFPGDHFDAIVASFCLPFLFNDEASVFIEKLSAMLKPGGNLYLSTMEGNSWGYEKTSFGGDTTFFFNYFPYSFLCDEFEKQQLSIRTEWRQEYPMAGGAPPLQDMIFILQKQDV